MRGEARKTGKGREKDGVQLRGIEIRRPSIEKKKQGSQGREEPGGNEKCGSKLIGGELATGLNGCAGEGRGVWVQGRLGPIRKGSPSYC